MTSRAHNWLYRTLAAAIPPPPVKSVVQWAVKHVKLIGSVLAESYNPDITPWTKEPIEATADGTRKGTFVKPIQCGGSETGVIGILYRIATGAGGDIQYNWPNDDKAKEKWTKQIEKKLKACKPVMARVAEGELKWSKGLIAFPHCNLTVQGVFTDTNVTSDSIAFQVNEELHDTSGGWFPGRLDQAYGRLTACWNSVVFNISNAGKRGGELHQAFEAGTKQYWQVKCPGCGQYHSMRTRWENEKPELGGLRYDLADCLNSDNSINAEKLKSTIRFQMPCGFLVHDIPQERRPLSLSGRYSEPTNPGAPLTERSWTLEGVSVDYIPYIDLILQKHKALKIMKYGDAEPWWTYLRERECQFASPNDRPIQRNIVLSTKKKDREGLKNRCARLAAVDRQKGVIKEGELPHWWMVIIDVEILPDGKIHVLIVFEGKLVTAEDVTGTLDRHEANPSAVCFDSGWDTTNVYQICLKHGYNAIKGEPTDLFSHPNSGRRIYSVEKPLHTMVNQPPKYPYTLIGGEWIHDPREPLFWHYSKFGIRERFEWLRTSPEVILEIPVDVSQDFKDHMDAESLESRPHPRTGELIHEFIQHKDRNDLYVCICYCSMEMEMGGMIGSGVVEEKRKEK